MEMDKLDRDEQRKQRMINMERLRENGYEPFGHAYAVSMALDAVADNFAEGQRIKVAGRMVTRREMGKSCFAHIQEKGNRFQIYVKKDVLGDEDFEMFRILDLGDLIGVEGELFVTRTGEKTLKVESWTLLAKALRPLPEKWHGLQDKEIRYRQRYLDLIANEETVTRFQQRARILREIRAFLDRLGFIEVETPMLQIMAGGAAAEPFRTHYQALSTDMYLRIAPELYLKRLLVGGFDKVYELNRSFRNEGVDRTHNPEFTMLEIYQAYGDRLTMQHLVRDMIISLAESVCHTLTVGPDPEQVDLSPDNWREINYCELLRREAGEDWFDLDVETARQRATEMGCDIDPSWDHLAVTHEIYEKRIEKTLIQPTFVTRLPARLVPLARPCDNDPEYVDVFELIIAGREIAPGYSELNDPILQRKRFMEQAGGDSEKIDEDFLRAMEHGMPPAGGAGVGIDRLVMLLTGVDSIRDVVLFPHLKPRDD